MMILQVSYVGKRCYSTTSGAPYAMCYFTEQTGYDVAHHIFKVVDLDLLKNVQFGQVLDIQVITNIAHCDLICSPIVFIHRPLFHQLYFTSFFGGQIFREIFQLH